MIQVDCAELNGEEELALASALSDGLQGKGIALVKGNKIVIDEFPGAKVQQTSIEGIVNGFVSKRKDAAYYSVETAGNTIVVHSPDPLVANKRKRLEVLPPNIMKCPFCPFVTPYQELLDSHTRSHGIHMGLR